MPRPTSIRATSILRASLSLLGATAACLSGATVDLGHEAATTPPPTDDGPIDGDDDTSDDATADVTADVPDVTADADGGAPEASLVDGGPLCIPNPSFEPGDDAAPPTGPEVAVPAGWASCPGSSTSVTPTACVPAAEEGLTYLALSVGFAPLAPLNIPSSADVALCSPLEAGVPYTLSAEVALDATSAEGGTDEPPSLVILGGNSACNPQTRFLQFSPVANTCGWRRFCGTFTPDQEYTHLVLIPQVNAGSQYLQSHVLVDDLRSGGTCP
jgi:hypothetical protein